MKSNYYDHDNDRELVFDTKDDTARDNSKCTTYQVHRSLFHIYGVDTDYDHDHDHMLLQCKDNGVSALV